MKNNCNVCGGNGMTVSFNAAHPRPIISKCMACDGMKTENPDDNIHSHNVSKHRNKSLPPTVSKLTHGFDAWVVGSAADPNNDNPNDFDVQVPYSTWGQACFLIPKDAKVNSFCGFKFEEDGVTIDVWPGELGWIVQRPACKWVWHPKTGIFLTRIYIL
jgi:hypothetical protein